MRALDEPAGGLIATPQGTGVNGDFGGLVAASVFRSARSCGSNTCPDARIEHLRGRAECESNTCTLPHARGSNTCAVAGGSDRTDPSCSMPRIEHLRRRRDRGSNTSGGARSRGSRLFGVAGRADRHPSGPRKPADRTVAGRADRTLTRPGGVRIEHLHPAPRPRGSNTCPVAGRADRTDPVCSIRRIDTLRSRRTRGSTPFRSARSRGSNSCRTRGSNTCAVPWDADRTDPVCSIPWIETLRSRRTRGSTPFRPDPRHGSTPFAGAGRADRHPYGPIHAVDRHPRRRRARGSRPFRSARSCGSNTCRTRGSNTCAVAGGSDRTDPVCSMSWIEHLRSRRRRGSRPFQFAPHRGSTPFAVTEERGSTSLSPARSHGSTPFAVVGARIDDLHGRRPARIRAVVRRGCGLHGVTCRLAAPTKFDCA